MNKQNNEHDEFEEIAEKLSLAAFDQIPEDHQFSTAYQDKKAKLLEKIEPAPKKNKWTRKRLLIAAIALLILIPTSVYAASEIYKWQLEQKKYELTLSLGGDKTYKHDKFYQLKVGYIPETMEEYQSSDKYSFKDDDDKAGLSFALQKIKQKAEFTELFTESYEEVSYGGHQGVMIKKVGRTTDPSDFGRLLYLLFEEEGYVLEVYIGNTVPDTELTKVLEHVSLVESSKSEATAAMEAEQIEKAKGDDPIPNGDIPSISVTSPTIFQVGETVEIEPIMKEKFKFTVNKVDVLSSIDDLPKDNFNESSIEWLIDEGIMSPEHKLLTFTKKFIEPGDGKTTLDEVIDKKEVSSKFIYLTATIEPATGTTLEDLFLQNHPYLMEEQDGQLTYADEFSEKTSLSWEVDYLDYHGEGDSFYRMPAIKGKKIIHFGYFVDEDQLTQVVLPVFNYGNSDKNLEDTANRWLDLRQISEK